MFDRGREGPPRASEKLAALELISKDLAGPNFDAHSPSRQAERVAKN